MIQWRKKLALGILEFTSIPLGMEVVNRMLKHVEIESMQDHFISPGRYIAFITGDYSAVNHALEWAIASDDGGLFDIAIIGNIQEDLFRYSTNSLTVNQKDVANLFIFETLAHAQAIEITNNLLHSTELYLLSINNETALNGKTVVTCFGSVTNVMLGRDMLKTGTTITNIEPVLLDSIFGRRKQDENN